MLTNFEDVKSIVIDCYRKFKSHVYYSNNLQKVRLKISEFEQHPEEMEKRINVLSDIIFNESEKGWNELLDSVSYYVLPKIRYIKNTNNSLLIDLRQNYIKASCNRNRIIKILTH